MGQKPKKILGIDPGYGRLGWAVLELNNGKDILIEAGCFETPAKLPHNERLGLIGKHIEELFKKYNPEALALEKLFFYSNQKTALAVSEVRGLVTYLAGDRKVHEFTPAQVKQSVCGYGKADKRQVQKMIMLLLGLKEPPKPDDTADAIAVALCGMHSFD